MSSPPTTPLGAPPDDRRWTYDVVGLFGNDFGLSVAARNTLSALEASGRSFETVTVRADPRLGKPARERRDGGRRLNLFQLNPIDVGAFSRQWVPALSPSAPKVCVPFWELPLVPRTWVPMLGVMQAILAPTRFVQDACAEAVPGTPVLHYPQAVFLPAEVHPARARWGLSTTATVFCVSFDVGSDIDRKNPWAAVDAFQRAFRPDADVQLVIKMKPWQNAPLYVQQAAELKRRVEGDRRVRIVEASLRYEEVLELYASCDVMLSLHRSEGLGLHLMEAMSLGKTVVATNWSGNAEFMSPDCSVPIGCTFVPVRTDHFAYRAELGRAGQVWAEPDLSQAVEALRGLHANPGWRREMGEAAARSMAARRDAMMSGAVFARLEELLAGVRADPAAFDRARTRTRMSFWRQAVQYKLWDVRRRVGAAFTRSRAG